MTLDEIKKIIEAAVTDSTAFVLDPMQDGQHLEAVVVSSTFKGLPLIKQHQMVMKPLKAAFAQSVHALKLKTLTPEEWETYQKENKFG